MKNKFLIISTGILACFTILAVSSLSINNENITPNDRVEVASEEPIILNEIIRFDELYDFSDNKVLADHSDLVIIGKIKSIGMASNYNLVNQSYGKTRTPVNLEVVQVLKNSTNQTFSTVDFLDMGGMIKYSDYEKSLLPAQKAKREYLMQQSGINPQTRKNIYVNQTVEDQLEIVEGKTYIFYLYYNEDYERYMVVTQPYGIKEYNQETGKILNHITNGIENLDEMV